MKSIDQVIHAQGVGADQDMTALEYLIADEETRSHVIDYFRGTQKVLSLWVAAPIVKQVEDEFSISDDDGVIVKRGSENIIHKLVPEQLRRKIIGRNGSQVVEFQKLYSCPNAWDLEDQHIETIRNDHFFLKCYVKDGKFIMVSMSNRPAYSIGQRDHQKFEISISAVDLKNNSNRFAVHVDEITRDPKRPDYGHMILNYYFNERLQDGGRLGKKTQFFIDVEHSRLMPFGQGFIDLLERTDYRKAPHFRDVKSVFLTGQPEVRLEDSIEAFIYNLARHPSADRVFSAYEGKDAHLYFESGNGLWKGSRIVAYHYTPKRPDFVQAQARIFSPLRFCMKGHGIDAETYGHMRNAEESHYRPVVKGDGRPSSDDDLYLEFMPDAVPDAVANSMHEKASVNWGQWECAVNSEIKSQFLVNRDLDYYIGNALIERDSCVLADFVTKRKGEDFWRHFLLPIPLENADRRLKQIDEKLDCYGIKGRTRN